MSRRLVHLTASLASTGFHPAGWRLCAGPPFPIGDRYRAMARTAERAKLDAIWLGHDTRLPLDALPLLGSLIAVTERLGLGAGWPLAHAEPFHVARVLATLDHLAGGRVALLAGLPGDTPDAAQFAYLPPLTPEDAVARAAELVDVARQLWDSWEDAGWLLDVPTGRFAEPDRVHPIHHAGRFFSVRGPLNLPRPPQGNPPIVLDLPATPAAHALALREADILLLTVPSPEEAAAVRRQARPSQRVLVNLMPILADTHAEAAQRARSLDALEPPDPAPMRVVGTEATLLDLFASWTAAGACDGFNLLPAVLPDDLDRIAARLIPLGQSRGLFRQHYEGAMLREHFGLPHPRCRFAR